MVQIAPETRLQVGPVLTLPNGVTFLRILAVPVFLALAAGVRADPRLHVWAVACFFFVALSDWLDGFLARRLKAESNLGSVLDPVADKLLVTSASLLLASPWWGGPRIPIAFLGLVVLRDLVIVLGCLVLRRKEPQFVPRARVAGKVSTFVNLLALGLFVIGAPPFPEPVLRGAIVFGGALLVLSGADYVLFAARRLSRT